YQS
ncbi:hypothetical protein D043_5088B, partial [Vibrio parahaemolyticus EKP-021]